MDEDQGPVTKAAAAAALAELELAHAAREEEKEKLKAQAALVGETAFALAKMRSSNVSRNSNGDLGAVLSAEQLTHLRGCVSPGGKLSVAARARMEADLPSKSFNHNTCYDSPKPTYDNDAGVTRGKFSPAQVKQMMDSWGKSDTSSADDQTDSSDDENSDNWNNEYLRRSKSADAVYSPSSPTQDKRYIASLEKGRHHLQYTHSTSPEQEYQYQHHRVSNYHSHSLRHNLSSDSLKSDGNSSNNNNNNNFNNFNPLSPIEGGLFDLAKNWLSTQREKLHRYELERQVEDQRRKLVEEGRRRRIEENEMRRRWENRPAAKEARFEEMAQQQADEDEKSQIVQVVSSSSEAPSHAVSERHTIANLCGLQNDEGDNDEYTTSDLPPCIDNEYLKVGIPRKTLSGEGVSVKVDLPHEEAGELHKVDHYAPSPPMPSLKPRESTVKMVQEHTDIPPILSSRHMKSLIQSGGLPASLDYCKWERLYSLSRDGDAFDTFLGNVKGRDRNVLVVKTTLGEIFGGYADSRWEGRGTHRLSHEYYGSCQACLFRFSYNEQDKQILKIYKWTGKNRYVQLCDSSKRIIAFGGGGDEGVFGLCIEDDFRRGTTGHCETFDNEPLCGEGYFDVVDLEVWGFTLDF